MHACELARSLRIPRVIVPVYPGALSALGILISDVVKDQSRTVLLRAQKIPHSQLDPIYAGLKREIAAELQNEGWEGRAAYEFSADLRYQGQGYEINVPYGRRMLEDFHAVHKKRYGYSSLEREVEIVTLRMRGRIPAPGRFRDLKTETPFVALRQAFSRVWFDGKSRRTQIVPRTLLKRGQKYRGPAIVTEYSATTVIPPGLTFQADKAGNLLVEVV